MVESSEARCEDDLNCSSGVVLEQGVEGVDVVGFHRSGLDILPCLSQRHCIAILDSLLHSRSTSVMTDLVPEHAR
jgi:hypothetical protein